MHYNHHGHLGFFFNDMLHAHKALYTYSGSKLYFTAITFFVYIVRLEIVFHSDHFFGLHISFAMASNNGILWIPQDEVNKMWKLAQKCSTHLQDLRVIIIIMQDPHASKILESSGSQGLREFQGHQGLRDHIHPGAHEESEKVE